MQFMNFHVYRVWVRACYRILKRAFENVRTWQGVAPHRACCLTDALSVKSRLKPAKQVQTAAVHKIESWNMELTPGTTSLTPPPPPPGEGEAWLRLMEQNPLILRHLLNAASQNLKARDESNEGIRSLIENGMCSKSWFAPTFFVSYRN